MIHRSLKSDTILSDKSHRIQITDIGLIKLEMQETESLLGSGIFGEGWNPQADIPAFRSLPFEVAVGQESPYFVSKMIESIQFNPIQSNEEIVRRLIH
jgi:serine/threonine protein kinase